MITEEIRAFLQKPLLARMSTIGSDGYPHTVPVWFILDGNDLVVISFRGTRKVRDIAANPRGAMIIGGEPQDGGGYLFKGEFAVQEDPDRYWTRTVTLRYESGEQAEKDIADWSAQDMIIIRLTVRKVAKV